VLEVSVDVDTVVLELPVVVDAVVLEVSVVVLEVRDVVEVLVIVVPVALELSVSVVLEVLVVVVTVALEVLVDAVKVLVTVDDSVDVVRPSHLSSHSSYVCITMRFVEVLKSESRKTIFSPPQSNMQPARPASDSDTSTYFGP
jgi:hypothetical protein